MHLIPNLAYLYEGALSNLLLSTLVLLDILVGFFGELGLGIVQCRK